VSTPKRYDGCNSFVFLETDPIILSSLIEKIPSTKILKSQITNIKWFGKLTTLSLVEGQITMIEIQNIKLFGSLKN